MQDTFFFFFQLQLCCDPLSELVRLMGLIITFKEIIPKTPYQELGGQLFKTDYVVR